MVNPHGQEGGQFYAILCGRRLWMDHYSILQKKLIDVNHQTLFLNTVVSETNVPHQISAVGEAGTLSTLTMPGPSIWSQVYSLSYWKQHTRAMIKSSMCRYVRKVVFQVEQN